MKDSLCVVLRFLLHPLGSPEVELMTNLLCLFKKLVEENNCLCCEEKETTCTIK